MLFNSMRKSLPSLCENDKRSTCLVKIPVFKAGHKFHWIGAELLSVQDISDKHTPRVAIPCEYGAYYGM